MKVFKVLVSVILLFQMMTSFAEENKPTRTSRIQKRVGEFICENSNSPDGLQKSLNNNCDITKSISITHIGPVQGEPAYTYCCVKR